MNGYFQIVPKDGSCFIKLVPPTGEGEPIDKDEILEYLSIKNMTYDVKGLILAMSQLSDTPVFLPTSNDFTHADGEYVKVKCAPDNMSVTVRIIPPFEGGPQMSKEEFMREFSVKGICYGFLEDEIDDFLKKREYCTSRVLCKGLPPVHGIDAKIEYFFNTDPRVKPTLNEDGSVDFFNLNTINHCKEGDLLARLHPAQFGESGKNVKGEYIKSRDVKPAQLKYGHNIRISEDKTELFSEVNGHVSLVEGKVFVSNVFEVENVDNSIGNIDYDGSVRVNGNVCENFSVKAKGSIEVRGVVEGAYLEAGESITIARGMNGMHKGVLKAGGNIVTKFLENAKATAGGFVESESILHSEVIAGTDVKVTGKKGFIAGGRTCATNSIEVKNLGSNMGADTVVEVGMDTTVKTTIQSIQKRIVDITKQIQTIKPVLEGAKAKLSHGIKMSSDQLLQIQKLATLHKSLAAELSEKTTELSGYQSELDAENINKGKVIVTGDVYPGTKVCIGDVSMVVKTEMKHCRFIKEGGDVKMVGIY